jgi:shikimate dehydrogenase
MQNAAFEAVGLDWRYEAIEVPPEELETLVRSLPARGFVGANVTIPHKVAALAVADSATAVAREVGACNTLVFDGASIAAENTDVQGFVRALRERVPEAPAGLGALVLGAGGAARAVVYALLKEGARRVDVWNRGRERARNLVGELQRYAGGTPLQAVSEPGASDAELLVNATSVGMESPGETGRQPDAVKQLRLSADKWDDLQVVVDLVYRDDATPLVRQAMERGLSYVEGIDILVHQGAASFELWTGGEAPLEVMRRAARKP